MDDLIVNPPPWPGGARCAVSITFDVDSDSFILGRPAYSVSLYAVSRTGASADVAMFRPTPNPLMGTPAANSLSISYSSRLLLANIFSWGSPAASSRLRP